MTTRTHSARLFVAVDPPERLAEQLQGWARTVAAQISREAHGSQQSIRVLDAGLLHVTVVFLGERPLDQIPELTEQLQACARPSLELSAGPPLWLPSRHPRALAVELHDRGGALACLHAEVEARLNGSSMTAGDEQATHSGSRRFHPHITVARMRNQSDATRSRVNVTRREPLPPTPSLTFSPTELTLYRSWLSPEGASYERLASFALGFEPD